MIIPPASAFNIVDSRHPSYLSDSLDWEKWRLTYGGGDHFCERYLQQFSKAEDSQEFRTRKEITPIPAFAKSAINDIRNAIFQRMRDITRTEGSEQYRQAISGLDGGVDRRGSTMNAFLGTKVLSDLLVMGRVGVYVDNPPVVGATLAAGKARPYLYSYAIEDILSWSSASPDEPSQFQSILLQDTCVEYHQITRLPITTFKRYRLMWINEDGRVSLAFYDLNGRQVDLHGTPTSVATELELTRIPFVMLDLGDSLIKDVCQHQIALLNLVSRDVWYAIQANFPFYVEQTDQNVAGHLKQFANEDGTATTGGQPATRKTVEVGTLHGRTYGKGADAPSFIAPPAHPLEVSMALQDRLENQIRKLVNLAVQRLGSRESAESKLVDNQGLEAGLSFIGLVLENGERQIAEHWASYENKIPSKRKVATIKYPDRYSLKTDSDRIEEATKLAKLMFSVPGREIKREIAKKIVETLLGGHVSVQTIDSIAKEIATASYLTSDPNTIIAAVEAGLCGHQTGSIALGFDDNEHTVAAKDAADKAIRVLKAQTSIKGDTAFGARGVGELATDDEESQLEREESANRAGRAKPRRRGRNKSNRVTGS